MRQGKIRPTGQLIVRRISAPPQRPTVATVADAMREATGSTIRAALWHLRNVGNFRRSLADMQAYQEGRLPMLGQLWLRKVDAKGRVLDYGLVSCRVVTNAGAAYIVDCLQNLAEPENLRFHGVGTGTAAEATTDTALGAELTTAYSTSSTRPTGTLGEQSGQTRVYETTATITVSAAVALTEHGIFSQAAVPGGTLLDRSVFAAVNLGASESLQATYRLTFPSGG